MIIIFLFYILLLLCKIAYTFSLALKIFLLYIIISLIILDMEAMRMNKKKVLLFLIVLLSFLLILIIAILSKKPKTVWLTDNEYLYNKAISFIVNEKTNGNPDNNKDDFQVFTDFQGFGVEEKKKVKYAYIWILDQSYFVNDNTLVSSSGSSMIYKFMFENDEVKKVIT